MSQYPYRVLLFYKYVSIENGEEETAQHLQRCQEIGLKGRVLIADEGINGTVSGTIEQTDEYIRYMDQHPKFKNIIYKVDEATGHAFKKMHVRYRSELVTLRLEEDINPKELTGQYLKPTEFYEAMKREDTVILDARNDYEYDLGHFKNAIRPEIRNFRELPHWVRENKELLEGKKILTYCTGGVRCEKFSGWLKTEGFEDVAQLEGGIVTYGKDPEVKGKDWDGLCYVFDERISVPINQVNPVVVGKDYFTGEPCERYINCANPDCNEQIICSEENEALYLGACSHECRISPRNRYVIKHEISEEEIEERLKKIEEMNMKVKA